MLSNYGLKLDSNYPKLAKFPSPVQSLIIDQLKAVKKANEKSIYS